MTFACAQLPTPAASGTDMGAAVAGLDVASPSDSSQLPEMARSGDLAGDSLPDSLGQIPKLAMVVPAATDFAVDPSLHLLASRRHLLVALHAGWTVADLNQILQTAGGQLAGTLPGAGVLQFVYPQDYTFALLRERIVALRAMPVVQAVAQDVPMWSQILPLPRTDPDPPSAPPDWNWLSAHGRTWGLQAIGAPAAWNLNAAISKLDLPQPLVAVLETGFTLHADVDLPGAESLLVLPSEHGTQVAGVIAATWGNQVQVDGVAPRARILPVSTAVPLAFGPKAVATTLHGALAAMVDRIDGALPRPRVVNVSMGYTWAEYCVVDLAAPGLTSRCDPRVAGKIPDSNCEDLSVKAAVRAQIEAGGIAMALAIDDLNSRGPMLFVVAAGNDAGDKMTAGSYCKEKDSKEMGNFPLDLNSPFCWAAVHRTYASKHIVVTEALEDLGKTGYARAAFSNVNDDKSLTVHSVFAPGIAIGAIGLGKATDLSNGTVNGTSFAAPFVAGAAAFLLSLEPDLSNSELIELLTKYPHAMPQSGGPSLTQNRLNLFGALLGLDALHPNPSRPAVRQLLADFDDGTPDGCQRLTYDDKGLPSGVFKGADGLGDGAVNMRDFRRLRDSYLMQTGAIKAVAPDAGPGKSQRWDLNLDGQLDDPPQERWPRAALNGAATLALDATPGIDAALSALEVLQAVYTTDAQQPVPAESLSLLFPASADLIVRSGPALAAEGVPQLELALTDSSGALPAPWAPFGAAMAGLVIGSDELILTVPSWPDGLVLLWRAPGKAWHKVPVAAVQPGEDRVVVLTPCVPPVAKVTAPPKASGTTSCMGNDPGNCVCLACNPMPAVKITFNASGSTSPAGKPGDLTFLWSFSAINGAYNTNVTSAPTSLAVAGVDFKFGPIPCGGSKGFLNAKVVVSNGCGTATANATVEVQSLTNTKCF